MSRSLSWSLVGCPLVVVGGCSDFGVSREVYGARNAVSLGDSGATGSEDGDDDDDDDDDDVDTGDSGCDCDGDHEGRSELPYDVRPQLGEVFQLELAFLEEGPPPAAILSVTMDGGSWRLAELQGNLPFTVDQADCDHEGNRDVGRDRIDVVWQNGDGSVDEDHLDIRYCKD